MRLIDADALINDIFTDYGCDPKYIADETIDGLKPYTDQLILERIGLQPTIPATRWHRVEEELPEKFVNVILANKRGKHYDIDKGWWNGHSFDRCTKGIYRNVTHWMPLPEPPKEDA